MNNNYTNSFYGLYPEIKKLYESILTKMLLNIEPYYVQIKPHIEEIDFNTSYKSYLYLKSKCLHLSGREGEADKAHEMMNSITNFHRTHHSSFYENSIYQYAVKPFYYLYEQGNIEYAPPMAILGLHYAQLFDADERLEDVERTYSNTIIPCCDMAVKQDFKQYAFIQAVAYIEYARLYANSNIEKAKMYYTNAAKVLIKLLPYSSNLNDTSSVLFHLASELLFFISGKEISPKIIKGIYVALAHYKVLKFEDKAYIDVLKLWYIIQCLIADERYEDAVEYAKEFEKVLSKENKSLYRERYSLYKMLQKVYEKAGKLSDSKRCQILAEGIKNIM